MTDLTAAERDWISAACSAVDPGVVDVDGIHALTKEVAHHVARPMAPVSSFIWGVALCRAVASAHGQAVDSEALRQALMATVPATAAPPSADSAFPRASERPIV